MKDLRCVVALHQWGPWRPYIALFNLNTGIGITPTQMRFCTRCDVKDYR